MRRRVQGPAFLLAIGAAACAALAAAKAVPPTQPQAKARYEKIVQAFLAGKWDDLKQAMPVPRPELNLLTPPQRADLDYVREAAAQCRPAWWKLAKGTSKETFRVTLWGRTFPVTYVPAAEGHVKVGTLAGVPEITVSWDPNALDSTEPADPSMRGHGFTAGDTAELGLWRTIADGHLFASLGLRTVAKLHQQDKMGLARYRLFRANLAALYHCSPRSRHAALVIHLAAFMPKYGASPMDGCRRAIGSLFVAEVLADPSRYPSLPLPRRVPATGAEATAAVHYKMRMNQGWSVAEDRALRQAVLAFATRNDKQVLQTGKVILPNGLVTMLEPEKDAELTPKRDAWVIEQLEKAMKSDR